LRERGPNLISAVKNWWHDQRQDTGFFSTLGKLLLVGYEFLRDFLPDRRRQRFGDIDYDWEFRVDTTSANVGWRSRLIGLLNSPYQPVEPTLFREMMNSLAVDFPKFTLVDVGSGKGRALLLASEYSFKKIVGIELLPELNSIAQENIRKFLAHRTHGPVIESLCVDAGDYIFPPEPLVVFLNNPLPEQGLRRLIANLEHSFQANRRPIFLVYANPVLEGALTDGGLFQKRSGTHQYSIVEAAA